VFDDLDFLYFPSSDVAADAGHFTARLGGELVFAVERFGTRVAMVRLASQGPHVVLAQHLDSDPPVNVFRVADLADAVADLRARGAAVGERFEFRSARVSRSTTPDRSASRSTSALDPSVAEA